MRVLTILRGLRLLVLGETWILPLGVAVMLLASAALREVAPDLWHSIGGLLLLAGTIAVLTLAVARSTRSS
ncbi:MAG TPA: hypothetical protein VGO48_11560 [Conexibacter sp.]|jgi:hypothetical protein|nr:hypothetical protein [Conexibacter sp.]